METASSTFQVEDINGVCRNPGNTWACYHYSGVVEQGREGTDKNGLCELCSDISNPIFDCEVAF